MKILGALGFLLVMFGAGLLVVFGAGYGAAQQPSGYRVYGAGTVSCGTWSQTRRAPDGNDSDVGLFYQSWVAGYLSGVGFSQTARLNNTDWDTMKLWVETYCRKFPLDDLSDAAEALAVSLLPKSK